MMNDSKAATDNQAKRNYPPLYHRDDGSRTAIGRKRQSKPRVPGLFCLPSLTTQLLFSIAYASVPEVMWQSNRLFERSYIDLILV